MSEQSHDMEGLADAPEAASPGPKDPVDGAPHEIEHDDDDVDDQDRQQSTHGHPGTNSQKWLVNFLNTVLSGDDEEDEEADLDDPEVLEQKRKQFRAKVDKCLDEALAAVSDGANTSKASEDKEDSEDEEDSDDEDPKK
ncbi:hypothetical protein CAEBREN_21988 [Caenorhabditis brenneri]|uniref:Uncharacterized protein n=1 Tax=Caenorhabditis brenneri TaxID=135651 RepID=G0P9W8_CAEBE|nr:hypothetical protein CAEBREN_21988 [Caenorhabditis brenneri]